MPCLNQLAGAAQGGDERRVHVDGLAHPAWRRARNVYRWGQRFGGGLRVPGPRLGIEARTSRHRRGGPQGPTEVDEVSRVEGTEPGRRRRNAPVHSGAAVRRGRRCALGLGHPHRGHVAHHLALGGDDGEHRQPGRRADEWRIEQTERGPFVHCPQPTKAGRSLGHVVRVCPVVPRPRGRARQTRRQGSPDGGPAHFTARRCEEEWPGFCSASTVAYDWGRGPASRQHPLAPGLPRRRGPHIGPWTLRRNRLPAPGIGRWPGHLRRAWAAAPCARWGGGRRVASRCTRGQPAGRAAVPEAADEVVHARAVASTPAQRAPSRCAWFAGSPSAMQAPPTNGAHS